MRTKAIALLLTLTLISTLSVATAQPPPPRPVAINEIAWAGTAASSFDEWMELKNNTDKEIDITDWVLVSKDGTPNIKLKGKIPAKGFFLLERTDDNAVSDIKADQIYTGGLLNAGETLTLKDNKGTVIDTANNDGGPWPAGTASDGNPPYATMERVDSIAPDTDANWKSNDGKKINGKDAKGKPLNGTPKAENSAVKK